MDAVEQTFVIEVGDAKWLRCPGCGKKLIKLLPTTIVQDFPLYCRYCKQEVIVTIPADPR